MSNKKKIMPEIERQVRAQDANLYYPTDRLGPGSVMTQQSHTNASRLIMENHQMSDCINIKDPEPPLVPTGFENVMGQYSFMTKRADGDYVIVAIFKKNQYNAVYIGYDKKHHHYDAWKRQEIEEHSEGFCTRYDNSYLDSLEVGDKIKKGDYVKTSNAFDKYRNYALGKNLNTLYMVSAQNLEDGIMVMNGAENKMNAYHCETLTIGLANNQILINWYGDDDHYQGIPLVGEKTKKGILAVIRRIDHSIAPYALKKKRLQHMERTDERRVGNGRVIDIDIRFNGPTDKLPTTGANKMLTELYLEQQKYYRKLYEYMINIANTAYEKGDTYSDNFSIICEEAHKYVDAIGFFGDNSDSVYSAEQMKISITLLEEEKMIVGSKMVGRYGDKGVISRVYTPEESWHMEDGTPIELVVATLGIVGRLNQSQMNECNITELSNTAVEMMRATGDLDMKLAIVHRLMKYLNSDEADDFRRFTRHMDSSEKKKLCRRIEREGIFIVQDPIDNADMFQIGKAYKDFPPNFQHVIFPDGGKSMYKVICSKKFYMRLKQDPKEKYSARSRGPVNPITTLPAKSNQKKRGLEPVSDVPVRIGEYEQEVLNGMTNHPKVCADFIVENSTSFEAKMRMAEHQYLGDLDEDLDITGMEFSGQKNIEAIDAYNYMFGARIRLEVEEAKPGEYFTD